MACIYKRKNSPMFWINYKKDGKWKCRATEYRIDNPGDQHQARRLARRQTEIERTQQPNQRAAEGSWDSGWVETFLAQAYGSRQNRTINVYTRYWRRLEKFLTSIDINSAAQLRYSHAVQYRTMRLKLVGENTVIHELKFLGSVAQEAVRREWLTANPFRRMGLKKAPVKEKTVWTESDINAVDAGLPQSGWMRVTFMLGLYQAARLRQCQIPLAAIDIETRRIHYPAERVKGRKPFTQPIDERILPFLTDEIQRQRAAGASMLCEVPLLGSIEWRRFLDTLSLPNLSHHGLRVTWVTRAALNGVPMSQAKRFVNHGSTAIHEIYQKLNSDDIAAVPASVPLPMKPGRRATAPSTQPESLESEATV